MPASHRLQGRHALLTGAGGGIGLAVTIAYLREGANCSVVDLRDAPSAELVALLESHPDSLHYVAADVASNPSIAAMPMGQYRLACCVARDLRVPGSPASVSGLARLQPFAGLIGAFWLGKYRSE